MAFTPDLAPILTFFLNALAGRREVTISNAENPPISGCNAGAGHDKMKGI